MKKFTLFLLLAFFGFSFAASADSSLAITDVMYDFPGTDDGHEYVKIQNTGADSVDVTGYKFIDGSSATKHSINLPPKNGSVGSPVIAPGGFFILADNASTYLADNPGFSGTVLDSAFSLKNEGATVELLDAAGNLAASYAYSPENNTPPPPFGDPNNSSNDSSQQADPPKIFINEIMYDLPGSDDGREWVEVYNAGSGDADLSALKFFEAETNHSISPYNGGNSALPAGGYAVIAGSPEKFLADWPDFQGAIFDSSFSLSNTGESLAVKYSDGNIIDQASYSSDQGAAGDGNSLQKNGSDWLHAAPTPGASNKTSSEELALPDDPGGSGNSQDSSGGGTGRGADFSQSVNSSSSVNTGGGSSSAQPAPKIAKPAKVSLKIDAPAYAIANSSFNVSASGIPPGTAGKYVWNFGNGEVVEAEGGSSMDYAYQFPGQYLITLDFFKDGSSAPIKATAKIKAEENPVAISSVKEDGSIEISNKAAHQEDIAGWAVKEGDLNFKIPEDTVLVAGGRIVLPAKIIKFPSYAGEIDLLYPSGETASVFGKTEEQALAEEIPIQKIPSIPAKETKIADPVHAKPAPSADQSVKGEALSASAANASPEGKSSPIFPWMLGLAGIVIFSSGLALAVAPKGFNFLKADKSAPQSDFKILD
jgi:hypothetical protein